jgi:hypothetical protein
VEVAALVGERPLPRRVVDRPTADAHRIMQHLDGKGDLGRCDGISAGSPWLIQEFRTASAARQHSIDSRAATV